MRRFLGGIALFCMVCGFGLLWVGGRNGAEREVTFPVGDGRTLEVRLFSPRGTGIGFGGGTVVGEEASSDGIMDSAGEDASVETVVDTSVSFDAEGGWDSLDVYAALGTVTIQTGEAWAVELGDGLVSLGGGAFYNSGIRRISLPASLESIGTPAFASCSNLIVITVDSANEHFFADYVSGGLYRYLPNGTYELVAVPNGIDLSDVDDDPFQILEGTSRVGDWAMAYCESIHSVVIPASVRTIGSYAFYYMGMGNINDQGMTGSAVDRKYYPKYIFEGLQAPTLEAEYTSEEAASFTSMYFNFSYQIGYLVNDMVIPVNAKGFDSVLYEFFFMNTEYSEEKIEDNTQSLIDDLAALDVEALTAADAERVQSLNTTYLMLTDGQKAFVSEEYYNKLMQAVSRIDELTGGDTPSGDDGNTPSAGGEGSSCQNAGLIGGICGGVGGLLIAAAAIVAVMVVRRKKSARASQSDDAAQDSENLSETDERNKEEDDDE